MKARSERGKEVTKGANDFLRSDIYVTDREQPSYRVVTTVEPSGAIVTTLEAFHFGKWREKFSDVIFTNASA